MTDNEIIKALECCINNKCSECPNKAFACSELVPMQYALDLINRLKAEIEKLKRRSDNKGCLTGINFEDMYKGGCR